MEKRHKLAETMSTHQDVILKDWVEFQISATTLRRDLMKEGELRDQSREFLNLLTQALQSGSDTGEAAWKPVKDFLGQIARSRVIQGFTPAETAMFVFSLSLQPHFQRAIMTVVPLPTSDWMSNSFVRRFDPLKPSPIPAPVVNPSLNALSRSGIPGP